jgi:hypothetical protein
MVLKLVLDDDMGSVIKSLNEKLSAGSREVLQLVIEKYIKL